MAASSSDDRLGNWLTEAYGIISNIQSIVTDTATAQTASASATATPSSIVSSASASQTSAASSRATASNTATKPTVAAGSATSSIGQNPSITSASSASTTAAAAGGSTSNNLLPIILGTVLGGVGLICLALTIWLCCRRKRRSSKSRRMASPDDDEIHSWRPDRAAAQPMMGTTASVWSDNNPPRMTQHPAYRGIETGSSNPFVPPVPAPRRSIQHPTPALAKETSPVDPVELGDHRHSAAAANSVAASSSATNSSSDRPHHDPLSAGVAGLAAGVAAHKIRRKPVVRQDSASPDYNSPTETHSHGPWANNNTRSGYGHARNPSSTPLMSGEQPRSYTQDRPPTPLGLMGFIKGATAARTAAATNPPTHHNEDEEPMSPVTPNAVHPDRESYESFTLRDTPAYSVAQSHPAPTASRNSRRVSFNDHPESSTTPGSYRGSPVPGANGNSAIGYTDYAYPLPTSHHTNSASPPSTQRGSNSSSNSSSSPHNSYNNGNANNNGYAPYNAGSYNSYNAYNSSDSSNNSNNGYHTPPTSHTVSPPTNPNVNRNGSPGRHAPLPSQMAMTNPNPNAPPRERRLRLSDLRAREEELERLKEEEGWEEHNAYGGRGGGVGMAL